MPNTHFENSKRYTYLILSLICLGIFIVLVGATFLRPGADDYCIGSNVAQYGVLEGTYVWWMTWSGYIYPMFIMNLFVGWPLVHLPFTFASAIPFLTTSLLMGYIFQCMLRTKKLLSMQSLFIILFTMFFWFSFLFIDLFDILSRSVKMNLVYGVLHWQNLTGGIIAFQLLAIIYLKFFNSKYSLRTQIIIAIFWGTAAGMMGSAGALAIFSVLFCVIGYNIICRTKNKLQNSPLIFAILFLLVGFFISNTMSPGQQIRSDIIQPDMSVSFERILYLIDFTVLPSIIKFGGLYFSVGFLFLLFTTACFTVFFPSIFSSINKRSALQTALFLTFITLVFVSVARLGQAFSYEAYWHYLLALVFCFFSILFWGIILARYIQHYFIGNEKRKRIVRVFLLLSLIFSICCISIGVFEIKTRADAWQIGPAPLPLVTDIEDKGGWQEKCWNILNSNRKNPIQRGICE